MLLVSVKRWEQLVHMISSPAIVCHRVLVFSILIWG